MTIVPLITEHSLEYDPYAAEFERGKTVGLRAARLEYNRGFMDGLILAFVFMTLGAASVACVTAVFV